MVSSEEKKRRRISAPLPGTFQLVSTASPYTHPPELWRQPSNPTGQDELVDQTRSLSLATPRPDTPRPDTFGVTDLYPVRSSSLRARKPVTPVPTILEPLPEAPVDGTSSRSNTINSISAPVEDSFEHRAFLSPDSAYGYLNTVKAFESTSESPVSGANEAPQISYERTVLPRKRSHHLKVPSQTTIKQGLLRSLSFSRGRKRPAPDDDIDMADNTNNEDPMDLAEIAQRKIHRLPKSKSISAIAYHKARDNIHQAWNNTVAVVKIARGAKVPKNQCLFFHGENGSKEFHEKILDSTFDPKTVASIHIVLNYNDWSMNQDDYYSMGLGLFAGKDHKLKELTITILGNTLFTKQTHMISSGIMRSQYLKESMGVSTKYSYWRKIADGTATRQTITDCKPTVSISVKSIVTAICAIKNIPSVIIRGAIETELKAEIEAACRSTKDGGMLPPIPKQSELFNDMQWVMQDEASSSNAFLKPKESSHFAFKNSAAFSSTSNLFSSAFSGKSRARKDASQIASDAQLATAITKKEKEQAKVSGIKKPFPDNPSYGVATNFDDDNDSDATTIRDNQPMAGVSHSRTSSGHEQNKTSANPIRVQKPTTVSTSILPFAQDRQGKYNLRSRAGSLNGGNTTTSTTSFRRNSTPSSFKRRKANDMKVLAEQFATSRVENIVVDTSASPPLKAGSIEESVRVSAHRCEPPWDDNKDKYMTGAEQIEAGCPGDVILGWKVIFVPETNTWVVGREDEWGYTASYL